jgi:glycosyltransferase involved in cell wall biosynthesis
VILRNARYDRSFGEKCADRRISVVNQSTGVRAEQPWSSPGTYYHGMLVSVVIPTYSMERYAVFFECVESVLAQTYEPLEVVIVVDGNMDVFERVREDFGDIENVLIHFNEENAGVSASRTLGAEQASGKVVAMIDDDATAEPDWVENLVDIYRQTDAIAVGGHVAPDWMTEKPDFFPEEFYWLVGCDEREFAEHMEEVRNTYGSNISFKRDVFLSVGGYDENTGRKGDQHIQAHEAPVGARLMKEFGQGVIYNENAVVNHRLFDYRGDFRWLVKRAFWQGFSKRIFNVLYPDAPNDEGEFLNNLLLRWIPSRIGTLVREPSSAKVKQLGAIGVFTVAVGAGYLYGLTKPRRSLVSAEQPDS